MPQRTQTTDDAHTEAALFKTMREMYPYPVVAHFTIDGEPRSKARPRVVTRNGKTRAYTPKATKSAEEVIAWKFRAAAKDHKMDKEATYGAVVLFFNGTRQRRDIDNMIKLILDGLNGIAWHDDDNVVEVSARKSYTPIKAEARTEVLIYRVGDAYKLTNDCDHCGEPYETWPSVQDRVRFCSPGCGYEYRRKAKERTCEHCNQSFLAHGPKRETRFCSRKCADDYGNVTIPCVICGTKFRQHKSWVEQRPCCSKECSAERAKQRRAQRRTTRFYGECLICGSGTTRKEYRRCNPCKLAGKEVPK